MANERKGRKKEKMKLKRELRKGNSRYKNMNKIQIDKNKLIIT